MHSIDTAVVSRTFAGQVRRRLSQTKFSFGVRDECGSKSLFMGPD